jgi:ankyrin repeat protein
LSDALPLPSRPNLNQYKKLAKDLQRACKSADGRAIGMWATRWLEALARLESASPSSPERQREIAREALRLEQRWPTFIKDDTRRERCLLVDAQFFVAREHGFTSWPKFAAHVETLTRPGSAVSNFEAAVDAIVAGDATTLQRLLREHPELARARSTREHQSTLLHYVSANGVEDFRQKTPPNIVEIARVLLEAGADVNATSEAYGGGSTALGLAATSAHPERAGVQIALLETLLERGAKIEPVAEEDDGTAITSCLANGQPGAAAYLASRGAVMNLEGAAGLGRVDIVQTFFDERGARVPKATREQLASAFLFACGYGHLDVVRFLLERGIDPSVRCHGGETGLHWTSFGPHPDIAQTLLAHHAAVDVKDDRYRGTPVDWALFAWSKAEGRDRERGYELVALLLEAGATPQTGWLEGNASEMVRIDPRMKELLLGSAD